MKRVLFAILVATVALTPTFAQSPKKVAVIIKATDSDFWQYVLVGATNYAKDNAGKVTVTTYGPPSEADIDKQVAILEDVVNGKPDAIVIASTSSDASVPAIERAVSLGIPVITIDNKVNSKKVASHLATNNANGGALAADQLVARLKELKKPLSGKVGLISAMAGVQVLTDRDSGFTNQLKKIAPNLKVLPTRYIDNDIMKALGAAEDMLTANPDLLGFFADNNHSGDGVARAILEQKLGDKVAAVAFDSDPEEVQSVANGVLYALILQDPFGMGYKGVDSALQAIAKKSLPAFVDTGATAVTKANMNDPKIKGLLDPMTLKK